MKEFKIFDGQLTVHVTDEDWESLCNTRLLTINPSEDQLENEFVTGTWITETDINLWENADNKFHEYIDELLELSRIDLNKACRILLEKEPCKYVLAEPENNS